MKIRLISVLCILTIGISGCTIGGKNIPTVQNNSITVSTRVVLSSSQKTEYLLEQKSGIPYSQQWTYGNWKKVRQIKEDEAGKHFRNERIEFNLCCGQPNSNAIWVYDCDDTFAWDKPPKDDDMEKQEKKPKPPGMQHKSSIYRDFFGTRYISEGTLYIIASGSVDVYMDPPVGTALVPKPELIQKSYLGRANSLDQTPINIFKINPGMHCLYFVHTPDPHSKFFGLKFWLETTEKPSQTSDCQWQIIDGNCKCSVSNGSTEFLEADNDWNNVNDKRYPKGSTPAGTPLGGEWVFGSWSPVKVISYLQADKTWGSAIGGTPWTKQYSRGACWITHEPHRIPNDPKWAKETSWKNIPIGYTSIYRHTFTVDRESTANLFIYTNDIVDVYLDPMGPEPKRWDSFTRIEWKGRTPLTMNTPWNNQPSYYYVGRADKQTRGMKIDLSNLMSPGTHTLYFVHRNSSELVHPTPKRDYYGMMFTICTKEDCDCPGTPDK